MSKDYSASNKGRLERIALSRTWCDSDNERGDLDVVELAGSLESRGQLEPIVVYEKDGVYWILSGHRRRAAALYLGWATILALIVDAPTDDRDRAIKRLFANLCRKDPDSIRVAKSLKALVDDKETPTTQTALARELGISQSTISNAIKLLALPPDVRDLVSEGQLSASHAALLLRIDQPEWSYSGKEVKTVDQARFALAMDAVKRGTSEKAFRELVDNFIANNERVRTYAEKCAAEDMARAERKAKGEETDKDRSERERAARERQRARQFELCKLRDPVAAKAIADAIKLDRGGMTIEHWRMLALFLWRYQQEWTEEGPKYILESKDFEGLRDIVIAFVGHTLKINDTGLQVGRGGWFEKWATETFGLQSAIMAAYTRAGLHPDQQGGL